MLVKILQRLIFTCIRNIQGWGDCGLRPYNKQFPEIFPVRRYFQRFSGAHVNLYDCRIKIPIHSYIYWCTENNLLTLLVSHTCQHREWTTYKCVQYELYISLAGNRKFSILISLNLTMGTSRFKVGLVHKLYLASTRSRRSIFSAHQDWESLGFEGIVHNFTQQIEERMQKCIYI